MRTSALLVQIHWRPGAPADAAVRARIAEELRDASWQISQMEALLYDAHQVAGPQHAYLLPRLEMRLPLYDLKLRYKLVCTGLDGSAIALVDAAGKRIADVRLP